MDDKQAAEVQRLLRESGTWVTRSRAHRLRVTALMLVPTWVAITAVAVGFIRARPDSVGAVAFVSAFSAVIASGMLLVRAWSPEAVIRWAVRNGMPTDQDLTATNLGAAGGVPTVPPRTAPDAEQQALSARAAALSRKNTELRRELHHRDIH